MSRLFRPAWGPRNMLTTRHRLCLRRQYATEPPPATNTSRISRIESRLPRFLRRYVAPLRDAPISHISAFLILHELTAIVPVIGLGATFYYSDWLPPYISEGKWMNEGTAKFGNWLRKKGWISDEEKSGRWFGRGETGVRAFTAAVTAYAITKALLPLRLVLSVWATPWFARWTVLPFNNRVARLFGRIFRSKKAVTTKGADAAGTGAVGGGAVPPKQAK